LAIERQLPKRKVPSLKELSAKTLLLETFLRFPDYPLPTLFECLKAIFWSLPYHGKIQPVRPDPVKMENPFEVFPGNLRNFLIEKLNQHWRCDLSDYKLAEGVKMLVHQDLEVFDLNLLKCLDDQGIFS